MAHKSKYAEKQKRKANTEVKQSRNPVAQYANPRKRRIVVINESKIINNLKGIDGPTKAEVKLAIRQVDWMRGKQARPGDGPDWIGKSGKWAFHQPGSLKS